MPKENKTNQNVKQTNKKTSCFGISAQENIMMYPQVLGHLCGAWKGGDQHHTLPRLAHP